MHQATFKRGSSWRFLRAGLVALILATAPQHDSRATTAVEASVGEQQLQDEDEFGADWPAGPGREDAGYLCGACHSLAIVKQQGLSREGWDTLLDWMTKKQGMPELEGTERAVILDYLAANFGDGRQVAGVAAAVPEDDEFGTDWPLGPGREETGLLCNACHSLAIVKQQGLSHDDWDELLDWMVEEQGMPDLEPEERDLILAYLANNFGIDRARN